MKTLFTTFILILIYSVYNNAQSYQVFPLKSENKWFYHYYEWNGFTSQTFDSKNIFLILETKGEVKKDDGQNYFQFDLSLWDSSSNDSYKFKFWKSRFFRQSGNYVFEYGSYLSPLIDFSSTSENKNILGYVMKIFRTHYGPGYYEYITDSLGFSVINGYIDQYNQWYYYLVGCIIDGKVYGDTLNNYIITEIANKKDNLPTTFSLYQNFPNPFNPSTAIKYQIPKSGLVQLKVYDILGREVATLANEYQTAGEHSVQFSAANNQPATSNNQLTSGVYFYQLKSGNYTQTKKLVLMK